MKPDDSDQLIAQEAEARAARRPGVSILIVDDAPSNLMALRAILDHPDYHLVEATSGVEALRQVLAHDFAVIVMDVVMPEMSGFEASALIKQRERSKHIPIIFVTGSSPDDAFIFKGYEVGAVDYMFKPVDSNILRAKVANFVNLFLLAEALREANLRLLDADRHKDEFLGVISHEFRTPLHFITGFASILQEGVHGPLNAQQAEDVDKVLHGADRMLSLVDDLLDYTKLHAGKLAMVRRPTCLSGLISMSLAAWEAEANRKGLTLVARLDADAISTVDGDRIQQVLDHLVANAIKFTPSGGAIDVHASQRGGHVRVEVSDTGIGIERGEQREVFQPFHQAEMGNARSVGGTGLGLALARAIVEAHGGTIDVASEPGRGSTFWFEIPADPEGSPNHGP